MVKALPAFQEVTPVAVAARLPDQHRPGLELRPHPQPGHRPVPANPLTPPAVGAPDPTVRNAHGGEPLEPQALLRSLLVLTGLEASNDLFQDCLALHVRRHHPHIGVEFRHSAAFHTVYPPEAPKEVEWAYRIQERAGQRPFPAGSRITTHSTWEVIGKMSGPEVTEQTPAQKAFSGSRIRRSVPRSVK